MTGEVGDLVVPVNFNRGGFELMFNDEICKTCPLLQTCYMPCKKWVEAQERSKDDE